MKATHRLRLILIVPIFPLLFAFAAVDHLKGELEEILPGYSQALNEFVTLEKTATNIIVDRYQNKSVFVADNTSVLKTENPDKRDSADQSSNPIEVTSTPLVNEKVKNTISVGIHYNLDRRCGVIRGTNDTIVDFIYQSIAPHKYNGREYYIVANNNLYGAIDSLGEEVIPIKHTKFNYVVKLIKMSGSFDRANSVGF